MLKFDQMELLDADVNPLFSKRLQKYSSRDIVQFVPFRDLKNDPYEMKNLAQSPEHKEITSNLKLELSNWMKQQGDRGAETEYDALQRVENSRKK